MAYLAGNGGINWASWVGSSVVGVVLANFVPTAWGLGFAGILSLLGILCSLATSKLRVVAAVVSSTVAVIAYALPLKMNIVVAISAAVAMCLLLDKTQRTMNKAENKTQEKEEVKLDLEELKEIEVVPEIVKIVEEVKEEIKEDTSLRSVDDFPADYRERFWKAYPRKAGKALALRKLEAIRKSGKVTFAALVSDWR